MTLSDRSLHAVLDDLAAPMPSAGGGVAAGAALAMAASLVAMAARGAEGWEDAAGVAAQAASLRERVVELAELEATVFPHAMAELDGPTSDYRLRGALAAAAEAPLRLAEAAADVAELAQLTADHAQPGLNADLVVAGHLAVAAARACAHLVQVNLGVTGDDERVSRAKAAVAAAAAAS